MASLHAVFSAIRSSITQPIPAFPLPETDKTEMYLPVPRVTASHTCGHHSFDLQPSPQKLLQSSTAPPLLCSLFHNPRSSAKPAFLLAHAALLPPSKPHITPLTVTEPSIAMRDLRKLRCALLAVFRRLISRPFPLSVPLQNHSKS